MSYLRNNKALLLIITALLVVNIGLLYYGFWKGERKTSKTERPSDEQRMRMTKEKLRDEVGLNESQLNQYVDLRKKHFEDLRPIFDELRLAKDSMFNSLNQTGNSDSLTRIYTDKVCDKQKSIDTKMLNYFRSLKGIATNEQQPKMDSFIMNMTKRMAGGPGGKRGPGPGHEKEKDKKD